MNIINNIRTIDINCINNNNETLFLGYASDINSVQLHFILEPELSSIDYNYRIVFYKNDTDETISDDIIYNDGIYYIIPAGITHISNTNAGHKGFLQLFVMQGNGNDATMIASSNKFPYIIENSLNLSAVPVEDLPNGLWKGLEAAVAKINGFTLDTSELHDSDSYIPTSKFLKTLIDNNVTYEFILQGSINNATNPEKIYIVRHGSGTAGSMIGWLIYIGPKSGVTASSGQTQWYFGLDGELRYRYRVDDNSSWGAWFYIENTKNKKNTIERDTSQYPSSLAVYDALQLKEKTENKDKDTMIDDRYHYPSSHAVLNALKLKEDKSNRELYNITDDIYKYPSSAAVLDGLNKKANIHEISVNAASSSVSHIDNCKQTHAFYYGSASLNINNTSSTHNGFMLCAKENDNNITQFFYSATTHEIYYRSCINNVWESSWKRIQNESNMDKNDYSDPDYYGITDNDSHYPSSLAVRNLANTKIKKKVLNSGPLDSHTEIGTIYHGSASININGTTKYCHGTLLCAGSDNGTGAITQFFFVNTGEIYYRTYSNSTWGNWLQIETLNNKDIYDTNTDPYIPTSAEEQSGITREDKINADNIIGINNNNNHYASSAAIYRNIDRNIKWLYAYPDEVTDEQMANISNGVRIKNATARNKLYIVKGNGTDYLNGDSNGFLYCATTTSNTHSYPQTQFYFTYNGEIKIRTRANDTVDWPDWSTLSINSKMNLANENVGYDSVNKVPAIDSVFLRLEIGQLFVCNINGNKTYWIKTGAQTSVRVSVVDNIPTTTSQLINDGADGEHPFITDSDIIGKMNKLVIVSSTAQLRAILPWQFFIYNDTTHDNVLCYKTDIGTGYIEIPNMDDVTDMTEKMQLPPEVPYDSSTSKPSISDSSFTELDINQMFYCVINSKKTYWIKTGTTSMIQLSSPSFIPIATSQLVNDGAAPGGNPFISAQDLQDRMRLLYVATSPDNLSEVPLGQFFIYNNILHYKDTEGSYYSIATKNNLDDYIKKIYIVNSTTNVPKGQLFIRNGNLGYRDPEGLIHYIAETGDFMERIYAVSDSSSVPVGQLFTKNYELCYKTENSEEPVVLSTKDYVDNMIGNINSALEALL